MAATTPYILVVDDDASIRRITTLVLADAGFRVRSAADGRAALALVESEAPALVILNLDMPVLDGRGFFKALRGAGHTAPVLLLSAAGADKARVELGAAASMSKPFAIDVLVDRARQLLRRGSLDEAV